jgi:hypothetical protein
MHRLITRYVAANGLALRSIIEASHQQQQLAHAHSSTNSMILANGYTPNARLAASKISRNGFPSLCSIEAGFLKWIDYILSLS